MLQIRVIPVLLLRDESLVKTAQFKKFKYIGDPSNTVRIFNELETDEIILLDIKASLEGRSPNLKILSELVSECFMPLGYGGGITSLDQAKRIFDLGYEKVIINSHATIKPTLVEDISRHFGSQAVVAAIDIKRGLLGKSTVRTFSGKKATNKEPIAWAKELENRGAGEILLTSIDREGTWEGFDLGLLKRVSGAVSIPLIAHGGAGSVDDIGRAVGIGGASAVAVGSMVVFQKKGMGVLVNFPDKSELSAAIDRYKVTPRE
jgi:cyclase